MRSMIQRIFVRILAAGIMLAGLGAGGAWAQEIQNLGTFKFWTAWKGKDANGVMCYVSSQPQDAQPSNVNRDPIHFLVINRKGLGTKNEVQTLVGYPLKTGSTPRVSIDGKAFDMVIEGSAAWLASASDENGFVALMRAGKQMIVKGRSQRGTNTTDTYSLVGVTAALEKIEKDC